MNAIDIISTIIFIAILALPVLALIVDGIRTSTSTSPAAAIYDIVAEREAATLARHEAMREELAAAQARSDANHAAFMARMDAISERISAARNGQ